MKKSDKNTLNNAIISMYNDIKPLNESKGIIIKTEYTDLILDFGSSDKNQYRNLLSNDNTNFKALANASTNLFRKSMEYKYIIDNIRSSIPGMDKCVVFDQFDDVELHHTPMTIYDMATFIMIRKIKRRESFTSFDIAEELMYYHDKLKVGLVPLSKTMHVRVHDRKFKVSVNHVYGDWLGFFEEFKDYVENDTFLALLTKMEFYDDAYATSLLTFKNSLSSLNISYAKYIHMDMVKKNLSTVNLNKVKKLIPA